MKCKYCDYENPKDAVKCECCGAMLSTQRSVDFYKKQAKKRIKPKKEKRRREKAEKEEKQTVASVLGYDEVSAPRNEGAAASRTASVLTAVVISIFYVALIAGFSVYMSLFYSDARRVDNSQSFPISLYDPESDSYYFLLDGKIVDGSLRGDIRYTPMMNFPSGVTVYNGFAKDDTDFAGSIYYNTSDYAVVSEYGVKHLNVEADGVDSFMCTADGKYLIALCRYGTSDAYRRTTREVYVYSLEENWNSKSVYLGIFSSVTVCGESPILYLVSGNDSSLSRYDCETRSITAIRDATRINNVKLIGNGDDISFVSDDKNLCIYRAAEEDVHKLSDGEPYTYVFSPDGKTVAFTEKGGDGIYSLYVYTNGEKILISDGISPVSVSDGGQCIYAKDIGSDSIYSAGIGKETKKLAEGAAIRCVNGNRTQAFIYTDVGEYLSVNGNFPILVYMRCDVLTPISGCEDGFRGGIFFLRSNTKSYICRLGSDYTFEVISAVGENVWYEVMSDKKTVLFVQGDILYRVREGNVALRSTVGISNGHPTLQVSPNGKGVYVYNHNGSFVYSKDRRATVISDSAASSACAFIGEDFVFLEREALTLLPVDAPKDTSDTAETTGGEAVSEEETYSLYYSRSGGKKKILMSGVSSFTVRKNAIYVYVPSGKTFEGRTLYDVYGGTDVESIELLIRGVETTVPSYTVVPPLLID